MGFARSHQHYKNIIVQDILRKQHYRCFKSIIKLDKLTIKVPVNQTTSFSTNLPARLTRRFLDKNIYVTPCVLAIEGYTHQRATVKIVRTKRKTRFTKNLLWYSYATLRNYNLCSFLDLFSIEILPQIYSLNDLEYTGDIDISTTNIMAVNHLPSRLNIIKAVTKLGINFKRPKNSVEGKFLFSLFQVPFL